MCIDNKVKLTVHIICHVHIDCPHVDLGTDVGRLFHFVSSLFFYIVFIILYQVKLLDKEKKKKASAHIVHIKKTAKYSA